MVRECCTIVADLLLLPFPPVDTMINNTVKPHYIAIDTHPLFCRVDREEAEIVPEDWYALVRDARRTNRFHVHEMQQANFLSVAPLLKIITNRKITVTGNKVEWLKMHWIRVEKDAPYTFKYRHTNNDLEAWNEVNLRPKKAGRP